MKGFTRRQLLSVVAFALIFVTLFLAADRLLFADVFFSDTWTRIRREGKAPEVLILGNSHAFCSFVPSIINDSLGVDAAILGSSGQNSAGLVDSLEAVLRVDKPKIIIVEVNAFLTPYDQAALYHKGTTLNNINGMPHLWQRVKSAWHELGFESIPQGAFQLLRADLMWARWNGTTEIDYASDGSSLLSWRAQGVFDAQARQNLALEHEANASPLPLEDPDNLREFRRMMALAQENGVRVVLVKTPTISSQQEMYDQFAWMKQTALEYGDTLLGAHIFHGEVADMNFGVADFYDGGHVSRSGAARFTVRFCRWLGGLMRIQTDDDACFAYAGESVDQLSDGRWRYEMNALGNGVSYRFTQTVDGVETVLQDWSEIPFVITEIPLERAGEITVSMKKGDQLLTYSFMTVNTCVLR